MGKAIISGNVTLKTTGEIDAMRAAGRLCAQALAAVSAAIKPGVTTLDLDTIADLPKLEPILRQRGYSLSDMEAIASGNWLRFFGENLPA